MSKPNASQSREAAIVALVAVAKDCFDYMRIFARKDSFEHRLANRLEEALELARLATDEVTTRIDRQS